MQSKKELEEKLTSIADVFIAAKKQQEQDVSVTLKKINAIPGLIEICSPEILNYVFTQILNNQNQIEKVFEDPTQNYYEFKKPTLSEDSSSNEDENARTFKIVKDDAGKFHVFISLKSKRADLTKFNEEEPKPISGTEKKRQIALDVLPENNWELYAELSPKNKNHTNHVLDKKNAAHKKTLETAEVITPEILVTVDRGAEQKYPVRYSPYKPETLVAAFQTDTLGNNKLDLESRMAIFMNVLHKTQAYHKEGFVHLDLKPENINIGRQGDITLGDIDYHHMGEKYTAANRSATELYMPPEVIVPFAAVKLPDYFKNLRDSNDADDIDNLKQMLVEKMSTTYSHAADPENFLTYINENIEKELGSEESSKLKVDEKADVWSLGIMLLELVSGKRYPDIEKPIDFDEITANEKYKGLAPILKQMLTLEPDKRPNLDSVIHQLSPFVKDNFKEQSDASLQDLLFSDTNTPASDSNKFIDALQNLGASLSKPNISFTEPDKNQQENLSIIAKYLETDVSVIFKQLNMAASNVNDQSPKTNFIKKISGQRPSEEEWRGTAKQQLHELCMQYLTHALKKNVNTKPIKATWGSAQFSKHLSSSQNSKEINDLLDKIKELDMRIKSSESDNSFIKKYRHS